MPKFHCGWPNSAGRGSLGNQRLHNIEVAVLGGRHRRGPEAFFARGIDVGSPVKQRPHNIDAAELGG